jgi:hypothetical protein
MMLVYPTLAAGIIVALLAVGSSPARAEDRAQLNACQAMVDRAARDVRTAGARTGEVELQRCQQIVREWMLRDARRSVDEKGRPLR